MKNSYQRIRAGFACLAGIFFAFLLASCADFSGNATGSVSFSFDKSFIKAVSNAKRAAVLDDEVTGTGSEEQYNEQFSEKYIIEVSLKGGYSDFQKKEYSMKDWFSKTEAYSSGNETESKTDEEDSTASNGFETFTFKDIPVGVKVTATVDVYMEYNYEQGSKKYHMYTGTSSPIEIKAGENPLDLNVHELKSFYIILAPEESGSLPNLKKVNLYLVKADSKLAEELIGYAKEDDDESVIKTLEKTTPFKTYENLDSSYISDNYDLKTGDSYYLLSLAYTDDDKAYFGHPADSATGAFTVSENGNSVYVYLTLIEEDEPDEDDKFVNMTFNGAANDPAMTEGTFDIAIKEDGTYTVTRNYGETPQVVSTGTYRVNGYYLYYTEKEYCAFNSTNLTFASSVTTVANPKESSPVQVMDGGSGEVTAFEVKICNGKVNILFQMPHEVNIKIVFKVDDNDGNPEYEYKQENLTVSVTGDTDVSIEEIQNATTAIWQALASEGYTFVEEDEHVLDGSDYKIVLHFKKGTSEEVKYSIDVSTPYYNSDVDLELDYEIGEDGTITFTVKSGYNSYEWIVDGVNKTDEAKIDSLTIKAEDYAEGSHSIMVVAEDSNGSYSAGTSFLIEAQE